MTIYQVWKSYPSTLCEYLKSFLTKDAANQYSIMLKDNELIGSIDYVVVEEQVN